jgi:hypothetical protein
MTPPTRSAATPASNALPPLARISKAAAVVRGSPAETAALRPMAGGRWAPSAVILRKSAGTSAMDVAVRGQDRSIPIILDLLTSIPPGLHVLFLNGKEVHPTLLPQQHSLFVRFLFYVGVIACICTEKRCMEMSQTQ